MNIHKAAALLFVLMAGTLAYALTSLTIPQVTIPAASAQTNSSCSTLPQPSGITPITGTLRFNCNPTSGAFTVTSTGTNTPNYALPSGYMGLGFISHSALNCNAATALSPGTPIILSNTGDFDLCATYTVAATGETLASFSFTWTS